MNSEIEKVNIINTIINLVNSANLTIQNITTGNNRANNMGEGVEKYVKDLFANTLTASESERDEKTRSVFSFRGSKNYSPDAVLRGGMQLK